ncbi:hypothetical protein F4778DRAFT_738993 [Xylariomycetidae sp. FL2044]|nr:hypothetical protein F4778DRAFT_738993 [Xylariomycetidae sp. FL2044]
MAAPASKTIGDLNGKWFLNKSISDDVNPALSLQGIGWLTRKAIGVASVTLHVKQYQAPPKPPATSTDPVTHIDIQQVATGGLKGTNEERCLDFEFREHKDWLFGRVKGQSKWMSAEELQSIVAAGSEAMTKGWIENDFLLKDWLLDDAEKTGPNGEPFIYNHVESLDAGWTGTQVWGFQTIGGERRYARNVVIAKDGTFVNFKMIYDWLPEA